MAFALLAIEDRDKVRRKIGEAPMSVEAIASMIGLGIAFVLHRIYKAIRSSRPIYEDPSNEDMAHLIEPPDDLQH